jgi:hypothetical protein
MDLGLSKQIIARQELVYSLSLYTNAKFEIRIEGKFSLSGQGMHYEIDPDRAAELDQVTSLVGYVIEGTSVEESGALNLDLEGDVHIHVEPDVQYEAWTFSGPRGEKVVCGPGGIMSCWSAIEEDHPPAG